MAWLLGGVALLIWSTAYVRQALLAALGSRLRAGLRRAMARRAGAALAGACAAIALQSASATALIAGMFVDQGLLTLTAALAVLIGADVGSALVVQFLSLKIQAIVPVLIGAGAALSLFKDRPSLAQAGHIAVGLGLIILALGLIAGAAAPVGGGATMRAILLSAERAWYLALPIGALLTWAIHSSVASILLVAAFAGSGVISPALALTLVAGANVGSGLIPLGLSRGASDAARRALVGNLALRTGGALILLALIALLPLLPLRDDPAQQVIASHLAVNVALALLALPFLPQWAGAISRLVPDRAVAGGDTSYLDVRLLGRPGAAIGAVIREVVTLAETVETMLEKSLTAFEPTGSAAIHELRKLDDRVDRIQEEIKSYLIRLIRTDLGEDERNRALDLMLFATNLEHVGDIVDHGLLPLAEKRARLDVMFSEPGWMDLRLMYERVASQIRLATSVCLTGDPEAARELVIGKDEIRREGRGAATRHFERLRAGSVRSLDTSTLHLDILRDLKQINAHVTAIAYPILEAEGGMRDSRLRRRAS